MAQILGARDISIPPSGLGDGGDHLDGSHDEISLITARPYQMEMFEESMKENIIATLPTNSGKTMIAVLRIKAELDRCKPDKLIWFLVPTKALCHQQAKEIATQIPAYGVCSLTSEDKVEYWTEQRLWDAIFINRRIIVSTHQVLLDALAHAFVRMDKLALLVFDEAHHCNKTHPANMIMKEFYWPHIDKPNIPYILGLTASPVLGSNLGGIQTIEKNLNAICKTPRLQHENLVKTTFLPTLGKLEFKNTVGNPTTSLKSLLIILRSLDIHDDPYIKWLEQENTPKNQELLKNLLLSHKTKSRGQLQSFFSRARTLNDELGEWASNYFVSTVIRKLTSLDHSMMLVRDDERDYITSILAQVSLPNNLSLTPKFSSLSEKAEKLIQLLLSEHCPGFAGLIFATTRATVSVLAVLISTDPRTKNLFKAGTFFGTGKFSQASIVNLVEPKEQKDTLQNFRSGNINILFSTNVLEEGIDVPACSVVVCFDMPSHFRSFIQRRGRARKLDAKFIIMLNNEDDSKIVASWPSLEISMKEIYQDESRKSEINPKNNSPTQQAALKYKIDSTGALLTAENSIPHLFHFCNTLPASQYTDLRPEFFITKNASGKLFSAELTLPSCVDPRVRKSQSLYSWETERMARRDAALQAIVQLHKAKLLNDNLLPLAKLHEDDRTIDKRPSVAVVRGQVNPWKDISATWGAKPPGETDIYGTSILLEFPGHAPVEMELILPVKPETMEPFTLYWNDTISCKISSMPAQALPNKSKDEQLWRETTYSLLSSMFSTRMASGSIDFPILFIPSNLGPNLESWLAQNSGSQNAVDVFLTNPDTTSYGLVRDLRQNGVRHIFRSWSNMDRKMVEDCTWSSDKDELFLQASRLPKRTDFLHPIKNQGDTEILTNTTVLAAETCTIDKMPLRYSLFSALIPCITHRYENHLVAQQLAQTILAPVRFININLVCAAITASIASESMDYQKLEFIGDCILKTCTSIHIQVEYPTYHEGYLSLAKDRIVSNSKLARAATEIGLDQFILITPFTGLKWKPIYISNFSNLDCQKPRQLSTKVLADVVEALIGVAYLEGGLKKALDCLRVFIPEIEWKPLLWLTQCLYDMAPMLKTWPPNFAEIETLIDYQFTKKALLLEALTHPSSRDVGANGLSYQKLEFQGDSVLDYIVVSNIIKLRHNLSYQRMHLIRTALVNADFLAFLCTQLSTNREVVDIVENSCSHTFHEVPKISSVCLWQFMRHTSGDISQAQMAFLKRYEELCDSIASDLLSGSAYPWSSLCRLEADKYFSDIVESLIGGIYIDSRGDIAQCERMAEVIGILPYLRRLVTGDIHVLHPKEEIGHIADTKTVNYLTAPYEVKGGNCVRWSCTLKIGDVDIVTVSDGTSAKEVNTRAAHESVKIMRARAA